MMQIREEHELIHRDNSHSANMQQARRGLYCDSAQVRACLEHVCYVAVLSIVAENKLQAFSIL